MAEALRPGRRYPRATRAAQLIDVAERLFIEHGYAAVTMEDIARAAAVSRPIVYDHLASREGAYIACVRRARREFEERLLAEFDADLDPIALLTRGADAFFDMLEADPGRWRLLFGSAAVLPASHVDALNELRFGTIDAIAAVMRRVAPEAPELDIETAAHAVSGVGERLGLLWLRRPELSKAEIVRHYVDFCWHGFRQYVEEDPAKA